MEFKQIEKISNRTFKALECLYLNSKEIQDIVVKNKDVKYFSQLEYAKEMSTIHLRTARQSGHSFAIMRFLKKYGKGNWLIITPTLQMANRLSNIAYESGIFSKLEGYHERYVMNLNDRNIYIRTISCCSFKNDLPSLNGIIVDCASFISSSKREEIYKFGGTYMLNKPNFFIFVE